MHFDLFRISLALRTQIDIAEYRDADGGIPTREQWLRIVFAQQIKFSSRGNLFYFEPFQAQDGTNSIFGKIGRRTIEKENAPPEEAFIDIERPQWHAASVFIDPTHHEDGQQLAMEVKSSVGATHSVLEGLANHLNENEHRSPYVIDIGAISDPSSFWDFAKDNEGNVTALTLEAPVPNMFGHENDYDEEMRKYRDREKAQKVSISIKNPDGLNLDTQTVRDGVEYTAKTGGKITAKAKKKKSYNSQNKTKRVGSDSIKEGISGQSNGIYDILRQAIEGLFLK